MTITYLNEATWPDVRPEFDPIPDTASFLSILLYGDIRLFVVSLGKGLRKLVGDEVSIETR